MEPTLNDIIHFLRQFSGEEKKPITAETWIEDGLGITGDDGAELLEEAEKAFAISLPEDPQRFRELFALQENEYLFGGEGLDLLGIGGIIRQLRKEPAPVIVDLQVATLHQIIVALRQQQQGG